MAQTTRRLGPSMLMGVRNHHRCICEQVGDGGVSRRISDHSSSRRVLSGLETRLKRLEPSCRSQ